MSVQGKQIADNSIPPVKVEGDVPTIVWQPGGVDFGNTYSTFAGAYAAAAAVRAQCPTIIIDTTLGAANITTGGPYNLDNFTLSAGPLPENWLSIGAVLGIGNVSFTGTVGFEMRGLYVQTTNNIAPLMVVTVASSPPTRVVLSNGTCLNTSGATQPFFHCTTGYLDIYDGNLQGGIGGPVVSADVNTIVNIYFNSPWPSSELGQDSLTGAGFFIIYVNDGTVRIFTTQTGTIAANVNFNYLYGGDVVYNTFGGTPSQLVKGINGLSITGTGAFNDVLAIGQAPPWVGPLDVAFDGVNQLYVADSGPVAGFVNLWEVDLTLTPHLIYSGAIFPATVTSTSRVVHATVGGVQYIFCACHSSGTDKLYIFDATNGGLVGIGQFPVNVGQPTGVAVDAAGNCYTVDTSNGLQKFTTATLLASYPTPVVATAIVAIPNAFDVTSDGANVYVSDNGSQHIFKYSTAPALVATYTDGSGRAMDSLFWAPGIPGVASIFVSTNVSGEVLRIGTAGMTLANTYVTTAAGLVGRMAFDGTYLYVSDPTTFFVEIINPTTNAWVAHYASTLPGAAHMLGPAYSSFDNRVWVATNPTSPVGNQGLSFFSYPSATIGFLIGPAAIVIEEVPPVHFLYFQPTGAPTPFATGWAAYDLSADNTLRFRYANQYAGEPVKFKSNVANPSLAGISTLSLCLLTANPLVALNPPVQIAFDATSGAATFMTVYNGSTYVGNFLTWNSLPQFVINGDFGHSVWIFGKANTVSLLLDTNATIQNGNISLKTTTAGVDLTGGYFDIFTPIATPANPATGFRLYVDLTTGRLAAKSSTGVVTFLTP